jgi:hypothetical protein
MHKKVKKGTHGFSQPSPWTSSFGGSRRQQVRPLQCDVRFEDADLKELVDELKSKQEDANSSFPSQRVTTHTMDASSQGGLNEEEATTG